MRLSVQRRKCSLREVKAGMYAFFRGALRESKTVGVGGVLFLFSFNSERKVRRQKLSNGKAMDPAFRRDAAAQAYFVYGKPL